jgi:hypothetical protein
MNFINTLYYIYADVATAFTRKVAFFGFLLHLAQEIMHDFSKNDGKRSVPKRAHAYDHTALCG